MSYTKMFLAGDQYNLLIMGNPGTGKVIYVLQLQGL